MKKKLVLLIILLLSLSGCGSRQEGDLVIIDGDIAEMNVATYMAKIMIETYTDYSVYIQPSMAYNLAFDQIKSGAMDMTLSWDGTVLTTFLKQDPQDIPSNQSLFDFTNNLAQEKAQVKLLEPLGSENSYVVAVTDDLAETYNLKTISDLKPIASELIFAAEHSFFDDNGSVRYKPLTKFYDMEFKEANSIDIGLKLAGLDSDNMDVTLVTSADGMVNRYPVTMLEDDLNFFPRYQSAFLVRSDLEKDFPGVEAVLEKISNSITTDESRQLNYRVDVEVKNPETVARDFLIEKNLINK
ncbi:glycine betaine ABC transporter substrate-binding protein [Erysipelothrix rhusiopathiae]|nr:glycine betaine ABC transporter substrate-binding protein [Erysipelothrix rhusiopathiae]MDE8042385.1 glycine betaine ABC transporter substrate-binding protein [Erysipelothrix rhusiopathiae]MDE8048956.1 glycine betaine ABC transporter substrate-binding protein [Erysipelothrix rhusiopathiae]MDE8058737.1 glycine betaine ABC transporter substrate-binding protein [Erysipelothrix rhusiopathiae]MDE8067344.1 glycine betaine ABC transporter substrate-binding protein [Erysipelothrix rhusiopathiae]